MLDALGGVIKDGLGYFIPLNMKIIIDYHIIRSFSDSLKSIRPSILFPLDL
jgi:hypothetical protein